MTTFLLDELVSIADSGREIRGIIELYNKDLGAFLIRLVCVPRCETFRAGDTTQRHGTRHKGEEASYDIGRFGAAPL